ncbi:hypothetical protein V8C42DRAFT_337346 [Trichoderma barbatum]
MLKRKPAACPDSPRKKAKSNQPTETPNLQTFNTNAVPSFFSSPSSSLSSTPPRHAKRKRPDDPLINDPDESDTSITTKRARAQSPERQSLSPNFEPWPLHDDHPETQANIYWEPTDQTERAKQWRKRTTLAMQGYRNCSCGKMHYTIGRKSWHYPGQEPELEEPELERSDEPLSEPDESYAQSEPVSVYQSRSREPLPSPGLSDGGVDAGNTQLDFASIDGSIPREPSTAPDSRVPVIAEAPNISPNISLAITPTANIGRVSRQRTSTPPSVEKPSPRHKTRRKDKNKKEKDNKDKTVQRQPRNRKPKTTPVAKESVVLRRSSRRNPETELWFLDDRDKARLVAASSR